MKRLFTILLVISILFSLAYFSSIVAQEGPPSCPKQNKPFEQERPFGPPDGPQNSLPPGHPNCPPPDLTDTQIQELMVFCKEYLPTFYNHINEIKKPIPVCIKKL